MATWSRPARRLSRIPFRTRLRRLLFQTKPLDLLLKRRAEALVVHLDLHPRLPENAICLDIGCGAGHFAERVVRDYSGRNVRFIAMDPFWTPTRPVRRRLARRDARRILFMLGDGLEVPVADSSVDVASLLYVLHHVNFDQQLQVLAEARRVLRPGGLLMLVEDTPEDEQERQAIQRWDTRLNFEPRHEPHFYRSRAEWRTLLAGMGFSPQHEAEFHDHSDRKGEGLIRHTAYVMRLEDQRSASPAAAAG